MLPVSCSNVVSIVPVLVPAVSAVASPLVSQNVSSSDSVEVHVSVQSSQVSQVKSVVSHGDEFLASPSHVSSSSVLSSSGIDFVALHESVRASGQPNYVSCRSPVPSRLNVPRWRQYLWNYQDSQICDFLEYGWPVGYDYSSYGFPCSNLRNHQGALLFPDVIDSYLSAETGRHAVIGPFSVNPFSCPVALSPLNSVPKQDSSELRIIVDLSWPAGTSVNDCISSSRYLGDDIFLTYPTVDNIASLIWSTGAGCLIYKRDLRRAYRQFPVDPMDYPL